MTSQPRGVQGFLGLIAIMPNDFHKYVNWEKWEQELERETGKYYQTHLAESAALLRRVEDVKLAAAIDTFIAAVKRSIQRHEEDPADWEIRTCWRNEAGLLRKAVERFEGTKLS